MIDDIISKVNMYHVDLSEYDSTHAAWNNILLPKHFPIYWRKHVIGAIMTCAMGSSSVDHTMKKYMHGWEEKDHDKKDPLHELIGILLDFSRLESKRLEELLNGIDFNQDSSTSLGVQACLGRLQSSYSAARSLIVMGYYFESMSLLRQVIEQLSFCFALAEKGDSQAIIDEPQKTIGRTARFIPEFGKVYGTISGQSHIMTHAIHRYLKLIDGKTQIIMKSAHDCAFAALVMAILIDFHEIILEYTYRDRLKTTKTIIQDDQGLRVNPKRAFIKKYNRLHTKWAKQERVKTRDTE